MWHWYSVFASLACNVYVLYYMQPALIALVMWYQLFVVGGETLKTIILKSTKRKEHGQGGQKGEETKAKATEQLRTRLLGWATQRPISPSVISHATRLTVEPQILQTTMVEPLCAFQVIECTIFCYSDWWIMNRSFPSQAGVKDKISWPKLYF